MASIYNAQDNQELISRIEKITPNAPALWGKMNAVQMLKHTKAATDVAFGSVDLKINFFMKLLGRILKNKVFNSDFKRNSPTAPEFIFTEDYDFEASKEELISNIKTFANGPSVIKVIDHPFWGKMTNDDWDKLMWRHLDHHLRQFGV